VRATIGDHVVPPFVWERHAQTLRLAGQDAEANTVEARAMAERKRFAAGWNGPR
jgi:hypothetical protein